jgi:anti-sigma regulatory factor (Ser/Thr protein kinase)
MKDLLTLRLACEEIVVNVASYAYPEGNDGFLDVTIRKTDRIVIRFEDGGVPFNPLEQKPPNTGLSWRKRRIGGLGILLIRRKMDAIGYAYENQRNILTIEKMI